MELNVVEPFDNLINDFLGTDDQEDHQVILDVLETKENFQRAYQILMDNSIDFTLEDWNKYIKEVIHGMLDEYIGMKPARIAQDFTNYSKEINDYSEPKDYSQHFGGSRDDEDDYGQTGDWQG
jgi:hypothetical protein